MKDFTPLKKVATGLLLYALFVLVLGLLFFLFTKRFPVTLSVPLFKTQVHTVPSAQLIMLCSSIACFIISGRIPRSFAAGVGY
ncbi:MAG: hypothetical protein Q8R30_04865 [bacterium]|nr:hypothetical protein [bacterium]MDZ4285500.1 hypothetical protein [Candidatus Sungbacteria bacterium]